MEGIGKECNKCCRIITYKDVEKGNGPIRILNMPGFFHKKCKAEFDIDIVSTSEYKGDLNPNNL